MGKITNLGEHYNRGLLCYIGFKSASMLSRYDLSCLIKKALVLRG